MIVVIRFIVPLHITLPRTVYQYIPENILLDSLPLTVITPPPVYDAAQTGTHMDIAQALGVIWLAGFLLILLYVAVKAVRTNRLMAAGTEPVTRSDLCDLLTYHTKELGIRQGVGLFVNRCDAIPAPAVIGVLRPRIILPHGIVDTWPARDIEPLLLHELVHIRHRDLLVNWLHILVHAVFFFHPVVWLANSRIRRAREEICDDLSITCLPAERERYSLSMIRVGEEFLARRRFTFAEVGFSENGNSLVSRIQRIMHYNYTPNRRLTSGTISALCAIVIVGVALSCTRSTDTGTSDKTKKGPSAKTSQRIATPRCKNIFQ
jgi:beta-lactamase regulating signal transducer with metallopeptidase domain